MDFDPEYQTSFDGPMSAKLQARFVALGIKDKAMTRRAIARNCGISGSFLGKLLHPQYPAGIRTRHIDRVVTGLGVLELRVAEDNNDDVEQDSGELEAFIRFAHAKGFAVTFSPLA